MNENKFSTKWDFSTLVFFINRKFFFTDSLTTQHI